MSLIRKLLIYARKTNKIYTWPNDDYRALLVTTLGTHWFLSRQPYPSPINGVILDIFRINTFDLCILVTLGMILLAFTKEFSKITANVTMGGTLKCAEVTTLGRRTLEWYFQIR